MRQSDSRVSTEVLSNFKLTGSGGPLLRSKQVPSWILRCMECIKCRVERSLIVLEFDDVFLSTSRYRDQSKTDDVTAYSTFSPV